MSPAKRWPRRWLEDAARASANGLPVEVADRVRTEWRTTLDALLHDPGKVRPRRATYFGRDGRRRCWRECRACEGTGMDATAVSLRQSCGHLEIVRETHEPACDECRGRGGEWYRVRLLPETEGEA